MQTDFQTVADQILNSLGSEIGIEELEFEEESETCILQVAKKIRLNITCNEGNQEIILHTEVGLLPQENRYDIVEQLLEANLFWTGTHGATFSIERKTGIVILARNMSLYEATGEILQGKTIAAAIINIIETVEHWNPLLDH